MTKSKQKPKNPAAVALGRRSGIHMTAAQRQQRARKAANAMWHKMKTAGTPDRWFGLVLLPDPGPGGMAAVAKVLDESLAKPEIILWSRDRAEVVARSQQEDVRHRLTDVIETDYDPTRFTMRREYKPDTDAQLKGLRAVLDSEEEVRS